MTLLRIAVGYSSSVILLEYFDANLRKTRHRRIHVKDVKESMDIDALAKQLHVQHGDLLSYNKLIQLLQQIKLNSVEIPKGVSSALNKMKVTDIAKHNQKDDCWVIISSKVYNVTSWLSKHPGGESGLLKHAGTDCTDVFLRLHSRSALEQIEALKVGVLAEDENEDNKENKGTISVNESTQLESSTDEIYDFSCNGTTDEPLFSPLVNDLSRGLDNARTVLDTIREKWYSMKKSGPVAFEWKFQEKEHLLSQIQCLCKYAKKLLASEKYPMFELKSPVCVFGDIHGNYEDVLFFAEEFLMNKASNGEENEFKKAEKISTNKKKPLKISDSAIVLEKLEAAYTIPLSSLSGSRSPGSMPWPPARRPFFLTDDSAESVTPAVRTQLPAAEDPRRQKNSLLFMGDYVDRGGASVEVICTVLALKLIHPETVYLLRGNHETIEVNEMYGFQNECLELFGPVNGVTVFNLFNEVFSYLPIAATIDGRIFCTHGGISQHFASNPSTALSLLREDWSVWRDLYGLNPMMQEEGEYAAKTQLFYDLLWADPAHSGDEYELGLNGFGLSPRGVGCLYGQNAVDKFLNANQMELIIRAHEPQAYGVHLQKERKVITVFSSGQYNMPDDVAGGIHIAHDQVRFLTRASLTSDSTNLSL